MQVEAAAVSGSEKWTAELDMELQRLAVRVSMVIAQPTNWSCMYVLCVGDDEPKNDVDPNHGFGRHAKVRLCKFLVLHSSRGSTHLRLFVQTIFSECVPTTLEQACWSAYYH